MYQCIKNHTPVSTQYANYLVSNGIMTEEEHQQWIRSFQTSYQNAFKKDWKPKPTFLLGNWQHMVPESVVAATSDTPSLPCTGVSEDNLHKLLQKLCHVPENFQVR